MKTFLKIDSVNLITITTFISLNSLFMKYFLLLFFCLGSIAGTAQKNASVSFEKWISLKGVGSPVISSDGKIVVYSVNSTDWGNNTYDSEIWMWKEGIDRFN